MRQGTLILLKEFDSPMKNMIKIKKMIKKNGSITQKKFFDIESQDFDLVEGYFSKKACSAQFAVTNRRFDGLITQKLISFHKNKDIKSFNLCIHNSKLLSNSIKDLCLSVRPIASVLHYRLYDKEGNLLCDSPFKIGDSPFKRDVIRKYHLEDALFYIKRDIALFLIDCMDSAGDYCTDNYVELEYLVDMRYDIKFNEEDPILCGYQSNKEVARFWLELDNQYGIEFPLLLSEELIITCHKCKIPSDIFRYIDDQVDLHRFITFLYTRELGFNLDVLSMYVKNPVEGGENLHAVAHPIFIGKGLKFFRKQIVNYIFLYVLDLLDQNKFSATFCLGLHFCCYKKMGFDEETEDTQDVTTV